MTVAMKLWGIRLSDTLRDALTRGDLAAAAELVEQGDGMARSLAKEYSLMYRGLGITIRVMLASLGRIAEELKVTVPLALHCQRFASEMNALMNRAWAEPLLPTAPAGDAAAETAAAIGVLAAGEASFERAHQANAVDVLAAIRRGDAAAALSLVDHKEQVLYLPLHDRLIRFMADSMAFALREGGDAMLLRLQLETAEGQRAGFDKWEQLPAAEFAQVSAFLLKMHMGEVHVTEDAERYTLHQKLCGSGGRLQTMGAYAGPNALPFVENKGPLTFGQPRLPVYCSHCPIWNGSATLAWYGRVHWLFERAAQPDGSCTAHIYKARDTAPETLVAPLRLAARSA